MQMALWTKLQWCDGHMKFFDKAEDVWQLKRLLVTHLGLNWQLANSTYGVSQITSFD